MKNKNYNSNKAMFLVDSHCHLSYPTLGCYSEITDQYIANAYNNNVKSILDIIMNPINISKALDFSKKYESIYHAFGIHPCDCHELSDKVTIGSIEDTIISNNKFIAIGEIGLDYYQDDSNKNQQIDCFSSQCELAVKLSLPVIIHTRNAHDDTYKVLKHFVSSGNLRGVIHCFSESWSEAKKYLDLNFYLSFSGIVTFKNANYIQDVAKTTPMSSILVETDSPYLAPVPFRGKTNQPAYVYNVAQYVSDLKNIALSSLADQTTNNFSSLFLREKSSSSLSRIG